jgi:hypothetical protein
MRYKEIIMRFINISLFLFFACIIIIGCSCSDTNEKTVDGTPDSASNVDISYPRYETNFPLTAQYCQQFLNSEIEFCGLKFHYCFNDGILDSDAYSFEFRSHAKYENLICIDKTLNVIETVYTQFSGMEDGAQIHYQFDPPKEFIMPIFSLIQQNPDYFFNAEEFGEEESLSFLAGGELGHNNLITLKIGLPGNRLDYRAKYNAFCKGWDPGDDPPAELLPLINYIETTILPEMRKHPDE